VQTAASSRLQMNHQSVELLMVFCGLFPILILGFECYKAAAG